MTTQYTPTLKLALPVQGELSGTWGDVVNDNITSMVEQAITGLATIDSWTANSHTLTTANGTTSESRCAILELTDTGTALTGAGTVICPDASKLYVVKNGAGQTITLKTASGSGIAIPNGYTAFLYCDGTNVVESITHFAGVVDFASNLDIAGDVDVDGTLEADAITLNGTALGSLYSPIAGSASIVTTGALNSGSITSGFGSIDNGSSAITTTGTITGGTLTSTGNITVTGTVDGRDIATDGTKLDGIEAGADVTDTTNVTAALVGATIAGDVTINGTLNVRTAIDLADNDILRFGTGDDCEFFCDGAHMYTDLNSGIGNWYVRDGTTTRFTFDDDGSFTATANITAYSDRKLKGNLEVIPNALAKVSALTGYTYDRIDMDGIRQSGLIAQDVQEVLPEVVINNVDPDSGEETLSVAYGNMIGLLVEAIKELKAEVEELKGGK